MIYSTIFTTAQAITSGKPLDAIALESNWRSWIMGMFPAAVKAGFAPHHERAWEWVWALEKGVRPDPFVLILARGGGKSTTAETAAIMALALGKRDYILYIAATQDQADKHVASIEAKLGSDTVKQYYPELAERKLTLYGSAKGWRRQRLWTKMGLIDAIGLDSAARGAKAEDQRPSMLIPDDIDSRLDSPDAVAKKVATLTESILPTGSDDAAIFGAQNLIHKNSIFNQLAKRTADFLATAHVEGPHPAIKDLTYERRGGQWIITGGTPVWPGQNTEICQQQMNDWGLRAFLREAQHEVDHQEPGRIFPAWDELYHVISWSMFAAVFGEYGGLDHHGKPRIPERGFITRSMDWGTTVEHPCMAGWMWKPAAEMPLTDSVFMYREMGWPAAIYDRVNKLTEPVAPTPVALDILAAEAPWNETQRANKGGCVMSHEASAACNTFNAMHKTHAGKLPVRMSKWRARATGGIERIQDYLFIDRELTDGTVLMHPFRPDLVGRPRMYFVVADDQLEKATDAAGFARARAEIPEYHNPTSLSGLESDRPYGYFNDFIDMLRMIADTHFPRIQPLTQQQRIQAYLPPKYRDVAEDVRQQMSEGEQLCAYTATAEAQARVNADIGATSGGRVPRRKRLLRSAGNWLTKQGA